MKKLLFLFLSVLSLSQLVGAEITWAGSSPVTLSATNQNSSDPQIVMDLSGNLVAIWIENGMVKTKAMPSGGSWGTVYTLSSSGTASSPRIAIDPQGITTAIWMDNSTISSATRTSGGVWSSVLTLSGSGASTPQIAVDTGGDAVAVWTRNGLIESKTKFFSKSWQVVPDLLSLSEADSPQIAIGKNGNILVVWHGVSNSVDTVYSTSKPINGDWQAATSISDPAYNAKRPRIAVNSKGDALAVWFRYQVTGSVYSNVIVQTATQPMNGVWSTPTDISSAGIYNPDALRLRAAFDASDNAVAAWTTSFDGSSFNMQFSVNPLNSGILSINSATSSPLIGWSSPVDIIAKNLYAYSFDLTTNPVGDAFFVFMDLTSGNIVIQSTEIDIPAYSSGVVTPINTLSSGTPNSFPRLASTLIGNTNNLGAVWVKFNGTFNIIQARTGTAPVITPPTTVTVTQNVHHFGAIDEYYNTVSWNASSAPGISKYLVFRNGTFLAQVNSNVFSFTDNNRGQNEPVTYGIATLDNQGLQGPIILKSFP